MHMKSAPVPLLTNIQLYKYICIYIYGFPGGMLSVATRSQQFKSAYTCRMKQDLKQFLHDLPGRLIDGCSGTVTACRENATVEVDFQSCLFNLNHQ